MIPVHTTQPSKMSLRMYQRLSESRERRVCLMSNTTNGVSTVSSSYEYKQNIDFIRENGDLVSESVSVTRTTKVVSRQKKMQICVQSGSGRKYIVDLYADETMSSLCQKISDICGVQHFQVLYAGKAFRYGDQRTDSKTIADLGMKDRSMVHLVIRLPRPQ